MSDEKNDNLTPHPVSVLSGHEGEVLLLSKSKQRVPNPKPTKTNFMVPPSPSQHTPAPPTRPQTYRRLKQAALAAKRSGEVQVPSLPQHRPIPSGQPILSRPTPYSPTKIVVQQNLSRSKRHLVDSQALLLAQNEAYKAPQLSKPAEISELMKTLDVGSSMTTSSESIGGFVLIVEDDVVNSRILQIHLEKNHLDTHVARDGDEALRFISEKQSDLLQHEPDLIILDLMLPTMDGFEVCERIRKIGGMEDVPIIFLTAEEQEAEMLRAYEVGADDYITKSHFKPAVFAAKIKKFLQRRQRHVSQSIDALKPGVLIDGRYELLREVGRGGMGMVYLARHQRLGFTLALKAMNIDRPNREKSDQRFQREVQSLAELNHPNLIRIHDCGQFGKIPYYVMEYISGGSLYSKLLNQGALPAKEALSIAGKLASGLQCAHEHRILHRDLKTENILFKRDHEPVLTDFGLVLNFADENKRLTKVGCVVGTPHYMSPEQITQPNDIDGRSDVFSLGIVLYEMLTGQNPLIEYNRTEVMIKIVTEDIPSPLQVNPRIPRIAAEVCMRALRRKRNQRFPSAIAMSLACEQAMRKI